MNSRLNLSNNNIYQKKQKTTVEYSFLHLTFFLLIISNYINVQSYLIYIPSFFVINGYLLFSISMHMDTYIHTYIDMYIYMYIEGQGSGNVVGLYNLEHNQYAYIYTFNDIRCLEKENKYIFYFILFYL